MAFQLPIDVYAETLEDAPMQSSPLLKSIWDGDFQCFESEMKRVDDISAVLQDRDAMGNTCIHVAAYKGVYNILHALLKQYKLDPNVQNIKGATPLAFVTQSTKPNAIKLFKLLLKHGANALIGDVNSVTPCHIAAENNNYQMVDILLNHGIAADISAASGITPLLIAARLGHVEVALLLAANGGDICKQSTLGDANRVHTPLLFAQQAGFGERLTAAGAAPQRPAAPSITKSTATSTTVAWVRPKSRSAPVTSYKLEVRQIDRMRPELPWVTVAEVVYGLTHTFQTCRSHCSTYDRDATDQDLEPAEVYVVRVFARSIVGLSMASPQSAIFLTEPAAPVTPSSPRLVDAASTSLLVEWRIPDTNGAPADRCELQWKLCHSPYAKWVSVPDNLLLHLRPSSQEDSSSESGTSDDAESRRQKEVYMTYLLEELMPQHDYRVRLRVHNFVGWSYVSEASDIMSTKREQVEVVARGRRNKDGTRKHADARRHSSVARINNHALKSVNDLAFKSLEFHSRKRRLRETAAATLLQSWFRARRLHCDYTAFRRNLEEQRTVLLQYDAEDDYVAKYRRRLRHPAKQWREMMALDRKRRDERRERKILRDKRRAERQLKRAIRKGKLNDHSKK